MIHAFTDTEFSIVHAAEVDRTTVADYKKNLFGLLECLYVESIINYKAGGFKGIVEVDEALLGKKPTYGHGNITKVFKI